jgi:hypothetical protein
MAHRAPDAGCLKLALGAVGAVAALLGLGGATLAQCSDVAPAQKPPPPAPTYSTLHVVGPVRQGDRCAPAGATGKTNTGRGVTCGRFKGLGYDTWG